MRPILFLSLIIMLFSFCNPVTNSKPVYYPSSSYFEVVPAAERMRLYIPMLENKNVALVVNQTSIVNQKHLVDTLMDFNIKIKRIFSPEHGFRGKEDAGAKIDDAKDESTGIPISSLYGKNKKPSKKDLEGIDVVVFDIQDVGVRFYTYISTLAYTMEACAEQGIPVIVLDRPNPNGYFIDGPVLKPEFQSFVGMHPVPVVYGMTIGEYARMVNGEAWLENQVECDLTVIPCSSYTHDWTGELPVKPSPNLSNQKAIMLYPSTCFFEGTIVSEGRGTDHPFEYIGHPVYPDKSFGFSPESRAGAQSPKLINETCYGVDYSRLSIDYIKAERSIRIDYLLDFYQKMNQKEDFFLANNFIDKLAGTDALRKQILNGEDEQTIRASWQSDIDNFKNIRAKYLLYE